MMNPSFLPQLDHDGIYPGITRLAMFPCPEMYKSIRIPRIALIRVKRVVRTPPIYLSADWIPRHDSIVWCVRGDSIIKLAPEEL
jgi:hypothetical protein